MIYNGGDDLAGRRLTVRSEFRTSNPRRPFTHGWLAFEVLRRAPESSMMFEEYLEALFDPEPEIKELATQIPGERNAFQDLRHIRCDVYRRAVKTEPMMSDEWFETPRCSPGGRPYRS